MHQVDKIEILPKRKRCLHDAALMKNPFKPKLNGSKCEVPTFGLQKKIIFNYFIIDAIVPDPVAKIKSKLSR